MKVYLAGGVLLMASVLGGCMGPRMPGEIIRYQKLQYSEEAYIFYGCCDYGYFNNPNYDMGGPNKLGCYTPDCSFSLWR